MVLKSPDTVMGLDLPATRPDGREWLDLTKRWYKSMQTGPMAPRMGMEADWFSLMDLAKLKDDYWRMSKPSAVMAAEIRQRGIKWLFTRQRVHHSCRKIRIIPQRSRQFKYSFTWEIRR